MVAEKAATRTEPGPDRFVLGERRRAASPAVPIDTGTGPAVLLLHGQPGGGKDWQGLADLLAEEFRVVAPDRPGWGGNPRPATGLRSNAEALARMLSLLELDPPGAAVVVGHSLGGGVAIELALSRPDLVGALVLVGSVGVEGALGGMDRLLAVPVLGDGVVRAGAAAVTRGVRTLTRLSQLREGGPIAELAARSGVLRAVFAEGRRGFGERDRQSFLVEQRALLTETASIERRLSRLRVGTAVVHGGGDHVVPVSGAIELAAAIPGAELVVRAGAGHRLPFEEPEVLAAVVRRYARLAGRS